MRKFIFTMAALLCTVAAASELPAIVGHIPMAQNGKLVFGSSPCHDGSDRREGYLQKANGKIVLMMCWSRLDDQLVVVYEDGDRYTYPLGELQFTKAFSEWADRRNEQRERGKEQTL